MKYFNGKSISHFYYGAATVASIRLGATKVWEAVRSCFGSGVWRPLKPWKCKDPWKNR